MKSLSVGTALIPSLMSSLGAPPRIFFSCLGVEPGVCLGVELGVLEAERDGDPVAFITLAACSSADATVRSSRFLLSTETHRPEFVRHRLASSLKTPTAPLQLGSHLNTRPETFYSHKPSSLAVSIERSRSVSAKREEKSITASCSSSNDTFTHKDGSQALTFVFDGRRAHGRRRGAAVLTVRPGSTLHERDVADRWGVRRSALPVTC